MVLLRCLLLPSLHYVPFSTLDVTSFHSLRALH
nr:MAG TPA: Hexapeptide repeat including loop [Caudoviricetes sp.]